MAKIKYDVAKGVRDWYGQEAILRNFVRDTLRQVFARYGYGPLETPLIERQDTLGFKGGGEIQKEVFQLTDQGSRKLALRFDQTVPLARFVASNRDIKFPFKRYAIGEVFRDGPTQPEQGRYRIFTQCDVDVLGVGEMTAEAELFALAQDAFASLGLGGVEVKINNRKLLDGILDYAHIPDAAKLRTIITLDKMDKIGFEGVLQSLNELSEFDPPATLTQETLQKVMETYAANGSIDALRECVESQVGTQGYDDITAILENNKDDAYAEVGGYTTSGQRLLKPEQIDLLVDVMRIGGSNEEVYATLDERVTSQKGKEGLAEVRQLLDYAEQMGLDFIQLDQSLARGLDYYTGTTIEVYLKNRDIVKSAILAGGRFDNMVGDFRGGNEIIPAVGFSFGLERLVMILKESRETPTTTTQLYLVPIGDTRDDCLRVAQELRAQGVNVDMELQQKKKIGQSIGYADTQGIRYVGLIGENELKENSITVKDLHTSEQHTYLIKDVAGKL